MSRYSELLQRTWDDNFLYSVLIELTYRCNLDCFFCYNDLSLKGRSLSLEQYFAMFEDLKNISVPNITFSGGEPLVHPDFFKLGEKARELGFVVRIKSNGHAITGKLARRIHDKINPYLVEISLHGACADTHERQTKIPGSFERLMINLHEMSDAGLRFRLNSTLTRWNENEIEPMFDIADHFAVPLNFDTHVTPKDDGNKEPLSIMASEEAMVRLLELHAERRGWMSKQTAAQTSNILVSETVAEKTSDLPANQRKKHCGTGSSSLTVDPYGSVFPCVQWRQAVGNLHDRSISSIWSRSSELEVIRENSGKVKLFVDSLGPEGDEIGYCPALAWQATGSPIQLYSSAKRMLSAKNTVARKRVLVAAPRMK